MDNTRDVRFRRRNLKTAARRRRAILAVAVAVGVLLALGTFFRLRDTGPTAESSSSAGSASAGATDLIASAGPRRPTYGYSVISGGAWDAQELRRAVTLDPVVADHYRNVDPTTMRAETVTQDRLAYVSYRVDDRVYWTKRKVLIRSGETILTNGQIEIRSRCGNCIALEPMLPTSDDEPDESQFDALTDEPLLVAWGWGPSGLPLAASAPLGDPDDIPVVGSPLLPLFPSGGVPMFPGGPTTNVANDIPPGRSPAGGIPDSPPSGTVPPPGGSDPPFVGGTPGVRPSVGDSSPLDPFVLQPLLSNDSDPPAVPPTVTPTITPHAVVPEPGTLLLFGSGIAGLLARRYRVKKA